MRPENKFIQHSTVDPEIEELITAMLSSYEETLTRSERAKFNRIEDQGMQIDEACLAWGAEGRTEQNAQLKALRFVRKFSRRIYDAKEDDRAFDFPLIGDHEFWKTVDRDFMFYLDLQAVHNGGNFTDNPVYAEHPNGRTEPMYIATILDRYVFKSAIVLDGEPIHVYYDVKPVAIDQAQVSPADC